MQSSQGLVSQMCSSHMMSCSNTLELFPDETLSPALCLFPGSNTLCGETIIGDCFLAACSASGTQAFHKDTWQNLMALPSAIDAPVPHEQDGANKKSQRNSLRILSVHRCTEPWLRLCVFFAYTYDAKDTQQKFAVFILVPPHLETAVSGDGEGMSAISVGCSWSCSAPIRRLYAVLQEKDWHPIPIIGRSWQSLVDASQQKAQLHNFRAVIQRILRSHAKGAQLLY